MKFKVGDSVIPNWEKVDKQGDALHDKFASASWPSKIIRIDLATGFSPIFLLDNEEYVNSEWLLEEKKSRTESSLGLDLLKKLW